MATGLGWTWIVTSSFLFASLGCPKIDLQPSHACSQLVPVQLRSESYTGESDVDGDTESDQSPPPPVQSFDFVSDEWDDAVPLPDGFRSAAPMAAVVDSYGRSKESLLPGGHKTVDTDTNDHAEPPTQTPPGLRGRGGESNLLSLEELLVALAQRLPATSQPKNPLMERLGTFLVESLLQYIAASPVLNENSAERTVRQLITGPAPPETAPNAGVVSQEEFPLPSQPASASVRGTANPPQNEGFYTLLSPNSKHVPDGRNGHTQFSDDADSRPHNPRKPTPSLLPLPKPRSTSNGGEEKTSRPLQNQKQSPRVPPKPKHALPDDHGAASRPSAQQKQSPPLSSPKATSSKNEKTTVLPGNHGAASRPPAQQKQSPPLSSPKATTPKNEETTVLHSDQGAGPPPSAQQKQSPPLPSPKLGASKDEKTTVSSNDSGPAARPPAQQFPPPASSPKIKPSSKDEKETVLTDDNGATSRPSTQQKLPLPVPCPKPKASSKDEKTTVSAGPASLPTSTESERVRVRKQALLLNQAHVVNGMAAFAKNYQMLGGTHADQINTKRQQSSQTKPPGTRLQSDDQDTEDAQRSQDNELYYEDMEPVGSQPATELIAKNNTRERVGGGNVEQPRAESATTRTVQSQNDEKTSRGEATLLDNAMADAIYEIFEPDSSRYVERRGQGKPQELVLSVQHDEKAPVDAGTRKAIDQLGALAGLALDSPLHEMNPDALIQLFENLPEGLKSSIVPESGDRVASVKSTEGSATEALMPSEDPGRSPANSGTEGGDFSRRKSKFLFFKRSNQVPRENLPDSTRLQEEKRGDSGTLGRKSRKQKEKCPSCESTNTRTLGRLRRRKSGKDDSKPTKVLRDGGRGAPDEDYSQNGGVPVDTTEAEVVPEDSVVLTESSPLLTSDISSPSAGQPADSTADSRVVKIEKSIRTPSTEDGDGVVVLPDSARGGPTEATTNGGTMEILDFQDDGGQDQPPLLMTGPNVEDNENAMEFSEHGRSSSHVTGAGGYTSTGGRREDHLPGSLPADGDADTNSERTSGEGFFRKLFGRRRKQPRPRTPSNQPREDVRTEEDADDVV